MRLTMIYVSCIDVPRAFHIPFHLFFVKFSCTFMYYFDVIILCFRKLQISSWWVGRAAMSSKQASSETQTLKLEMRLRSLDEIIGGERLVEKSIKQLSHHLPSSLGLNLQTLGHFGSRLREVFLSKTKKGGGGSTPFHSFWESFS